MSDDTRRVLELLAQGKITVDEATELLRAMGDAEHPGGQDEPGSRSSQLRYIKIAVKKNARSGDDSRRAYAWPGMACGDRRGGDHEVNIRVPMALVRSGMRLGAFVPGGADFIAQALRERGVNIDHFSKMTPDQLEAILKEMGEITVDVDQGRAQVRISAE